MGTNSRANCRTHRNSWCTCITQVIYRFLSNQTAVPSPLLLIILIRTSVSVGEKRLLIYLLFTSCKSDIALNFTNLRNTFGTWFSRRVSNDFAKFCSYYNQVCVKRNKCYFSKTGIISNRCWDIFGCKLSLILRYYQQWGSTCVCLKREILRVLVAACVCSRGLDRGLGK